MNGGIGENNQWEATGGVNTTIKLRRVPDGTIVHWLNGHRDLVWSVAWSPDGRLLASGSRDNTIRLWRVADGARLAAWSPPTAHAQGAYKGVMSVAFSPDGRLLAASGVDAAWVWSVSDQHLLWTCSVSSSEAVFSPDGRWLATRGAGSIELWDAQSGRRIAAMSDPSVGLCRLTFSPDATSLASCERSGSIDLRAVRDGRVIRVLEGNPVGTWRLAFSPDGKLLFCGGTEKTEEVHREDRSRFFGGVRVRRLGDGKLLARLPVGENSVQSLAVSADGHWLAAGLRDEIALWRVTW